MVKEYVPKRGDIEWLEFKPQAGLEQLGKRPALVLSHENYNKVVGLGIFCPIASKVKGYPFEVSWVQTSIATLYQTSCNRNLNLPLPENNVIQGVIISD